MKFAAWVDDMISDLADSDSVAKVALLDCLDPGTELLAQVRDIRYREQRIASREFYLLTDAVLVWVSATVNRKSATRAGSVHICTKSYPLSAIVQVTRTLIVTHDPDADDFDETLIKFDFRFSAASGLGELSLPAPQPEDLPMKPAATSEYYNFAQLLSRLITVRKP